MNKGDIVLQAREITSLDTTDVTATLADLYVKDGYNRMIEAERRWPFFEASTTLSSVAGQRDYPMSAITTTVNATSVGFREVTSLVDSSASGSRLAWIGYDDAESVWLGGSDTAGIPLYYSLWGQNINLWPKPVGVRSYSVRGYRKPLDWSASDGIEVDADERLHASLVYYVCAQMYQLQEDVELSNNYRATFGEAVRLARDDIMREPSAWPLILSGGGRVARLHGPTQGATGWSQ